MSALFMFVMLRVGTAKQVILVHIAVMQCGARRAMLGLKAAEA
jgi:hypothetical protein